MKLIVTFTWPLCKFSTYVEQLCKYMPYVYLYSVTTNIGRNWVNFIVIVLVLHTFDL